MGLKELIHEMKRHKLWDILFVGFVSHKDWKARYGDTRAWDVLFSWLPNGMTGEMYVENMVGEVPPKAQAIMRKHFLAYVRSHCKKVATSKLPVVACAYCGVSGTEQKLSYCLGCKDQDPPYYCSRECQKQDWKAGHKRVCKRSNKK